LDTVSRYSEAGEASFFRTLIRLMCGDVKKLAEAPTGKK
jgi:hypothetical protein